MEMISSYQSESESDIEEAAEEEELWVLDPVFTTTKTKAPTTTPSKKLLSSEKDCLEYESPVTRSQTKKVDCLEYHSPVTRSQTKKTQQPNSTTPPAKKKPAPRARVKLAFRVSDGTTLEAEAESPVKVKHLCFTCGMEFSTSQGHNQHRKLIHSPARAKYRCTDCNAVYESITQYRAHRLNHEPNEDHLFPCTDCQKKYRHKKNLKFHRASEHKVGRLTTSETCGLCQKTVQDLRRHERTVHSSVRHVCQCGMGFTRKDARNRHMRKCRHVVEER